MNRDATVELGFASWKDGSFELIVRDKGGCGATTLKGNLDKGQFEEVDRLLPTCVFVYGKAFDLKALVASWRALREKAEAMFASMQYGNEASDEACEAMGLAIKQAQELDK